LKINRFMLRRITHAMWFMPAMFSMFALLVVGFAYFSEAFFPDSLNADKLPITVSTSAVRNILTIVASSMLAVTVFSLSTMVNLISTVSQSTSPRAVQLVVSDRTTQTSISIFIGAFLFSIVSIIGLSGEIYSIGGRLVLFIATAIVVGAVVWAMIHWIGHISKIGRVGETIERVEKATARALEKFGQRGLYRCACEAGERRFGHKILADQVGFVQHFDREVLQGIADENELELHILIQPGNYVDFTTAILGISEPVDEETCDELRRAFTLGDERTFDFDPGFGLAVLSEIGLKALSPAINDQGTAARVVVTQVRVLASFVHKREEDDGHETEEAEMKFPRLFVRPQKLERLLLPSLQRMALESNSPEVDAALMRGLKTLATVAPGEFGQAAFKIAETLKRKAATQGVPQAARSGLRTG
jgi:uncharacterized membrane protein